MINAAKADGQIDGTEMNNILSKLDEAGAGQETKDFVLAEMRRPLDLDWLVAGVSTPDAGGRRLRRLDHGDQGRHPCRAELSDASWPRRLGISQQVRTSLDASLGVGRSRLRR